MIKNRKETAAPRAEAAQPDVKRRPAHSIRVEDVSVSIWAREHLVQGSPRTFYGCTFERSYKDRDGRYRYTKSFDLDSLGKVVACAEQADTWIRNQLDD